MTEPGAVYQTTPSEHDEQAAFVAWCKLQETRWPALALGFAVPNGIPFPGLNAIGRAKIINHMKAEGMRPGVLDWWLPVKSGEYGYLAIEFKRRDGALSDEQKEYIDLLDKYGGGFVSVCFSFDEACETLEWYLDGAK